MKQMAYKLVIEKPVAEVFSACLNPKNTPLWVDGISEEQISESPVKLGTTYKSRGDSDDWSYYTVVGFEQDRLFVLSSNDSAYNVSYTFKPLGDDQTEFEYKEWMSKGELDEPLPEAAIMKLKNLIEN